MAISKPKLTIKNFTGMGDNGMYWLDGFVPRSMQGQTILTQGWGNYNFIDTSDTGFSDLGSSPSISMTQYQHIDRNQVASMNGSGCIYDFNIYGTNAIGKIHAVANSAPSFFCQGGNLFTTRLNNFLYSSSNHVGVAWVGKATGGSATTLIDTTRNFTTLGIGSGTGVNKIYNLTKGLEKTITSVSTTTNTNDTLNFATGTAHAANDWYIAFCDTRFTLGTTSVANQHYYGQPDPIYWNRQIALWNDTYYILNGNYISSLASDETTWTADLIGNQTAPSDKFKKQLPSNHQALMFDVNQDKMLVCAYNQGKGVLLLWDGYAPAWISVINTDVPAAGIVKYNNGWIVLIGTSLWYTDGYTMQYLDRLPDASYVDNNVGRKYNMIKTEDGIIISYSGSVYNRLVSGFYIYTLDTKSWAYMPALNKLGKLSRENGALFALSETSDTFSQSTPHIFSTYSEGINVVRNKNAYKSSLILYIKLPQKMNIGMVELNLAPSTTEATIINKNNTISVNYGEGKNQMNGYTQSSTGSTATLIKNAIGNIARTSVGQEILFSGGNTGYERSFITAIANPGLNTEELTISPALSATPSSTSTYIHRYDLYSAGSLVVNSDAFPQEINFNIPAFYSDKLWLEIVFDGQDVFPLDLHSINIY